jgi:outer membrane protein assembly factor BamA
MRASSAAMLVVVAASPLAARGLAAQKPDSQATATQKPDSQAAAAPGATIDSALAAQAAAEQPEPGARWRTSYFPYLTGGANDSPVLSFRVRHWQPAEYEARSTYTAAFNGDAGIAPKGSRFVAASFRAPSLGTDWRLASVAAAERQARYGFYGLGNDTQYDKQAVNDAAPFLYRMRRTRYRGAVEVTRRIHGPLHAAFLAAVWHVKFTSLPGSSIFASEFPTGVLREDDVTGRFAVVYDTRDNEYNTRQGLLLEAGTQVGSGGSGNGYTRQYAILRGYLQVREGTVLAARIAGSGMGGRPTLDSRFALPGWEKEVPVLGGEYSHRSLDYGRLTGRGTLFGNFEVRHDLLSLGDLGAITLLAFMDAGRVFDQESFRVTTKDMKVGGGGGVAIRILRSSIFTFNFAGGPDGFNFSVGTGWMF